MDQARNEIVERLLDTYSSWYTLERPEGEEPLTAKGEFHEHGTGYLFTKKAEMWTADCHEYLYIYSMPQLTTEAFTACLDRTRSLGEPLVQPQKNHKSTYLTMVIVCDTADEDALKALKKCRVRKSFHFSLYGWMEVHTAAVVLRGDTIVSNGDGRQTREFLKNVLHPRKKDLRYKLFKK